MSDCSLPAARTLAPVMSHHRAPTTRGPAPQRWWCLGLALLSLLAAGGPREAVAQDTRTAFDRHFTDRTMRVDYFHTGRADERVVTLDRVLDDGAWAGSRTRLLDDTNLGKYLFEVIDRRTNAVVYSRGFATLYGEWETTPEARTEWRTFHDSLRFPWPKAPVQVVVKRRGADGRFDQIWSTVIDPASRFVNRAAPRGVPAGQSGPDGPGVPAGGAARTWTLLEHGPPSEKVDILILGEGYTDAQLTKFRDDAARLVGALFTYEPFKSRRSDFNVRAIGLPADRPGVHRPRAGEPRRTPVSAEYNIFDSERYLLVQDNRALRDAASVVPYEFIEVLVNEEHYGGGGIFNAHATAAAGNAYAEYLFVHEFAHHFAALADEYYTSDVAYETGAANPPEPWEPNVTATTDRDRIKWRDLVDAATPLPTPWPKTEFEAAQREYQQTRRALRERNAPEREMTALFDRERALETTLLGSAPQASKVGAFEGAGYEATGLYRPEVDCVMFSRNDVGFCRVCQRAISRIIDLSSRP
jgi:hypothetical protein